MPIIGTEVSKKKAARVFPLGPQEKVFRISPEALRVARQPLGTQSKSVLDENDMDKIF
jgi:hypothetical protein